MKQNSTKTSNTKTINTNKGNLNQPPNQNPIKQVQKIEQPKKVEVPPGENVFTYGSLMYPELMYKVVKQKQYHEEKATLKSYARRPVVGCVYPGITRKQNSSVQGKLYFNVTQEDLGLLDQFEGGQYRLIDVEVEMADQMKVKAKTYEFKNVEDLEDKEWDVEYYEANHKGKVCQIY